MRVASNPYRIDGPLEAGEAFIGREDVFTWIEESLQSGESMLVLYGLPKTGKTSLLRRLPHRLAGGGYTCLFNEAPPSFDQKPADWLSQLQQDISRAVQEAPGGARLLLLIDGLSLYNRSQDTWQPVLASLRELGQSFRLRILLAVQGHVAQVRDDPTSPWAAIPAKQLGYLTESQVEELLVQTAGGRLRYDYDAVRSVHLWTAGHPYFVQLFGYELFDYCGRVGRVNVHAVDKVLERVLNAADEALLYLWRNLSSAARMAMTAFGERHGRHDLFAGQDIHNFLRWQGVQISAEDIAEALAELTANGILARLGKDSYRVEITLLKRWLERNKPAAEVVREVRRYKRTGPPRPPDRRERPIRWMSLFNWAVSILLILLIIWMWRSRDLPSPSTAPAITAVASGTVTSSPSALATLPPKQLVYARRENKDAPWKIYTMRDDGSGSVALTDGTSQDTWPSWSPDGRRILFVSNRQGNRDIWVMDANGKRLVNLTRHSADDWTPVWNPQGDAIAFSSYRDGNWEIYRMAADGSRPVRLTNHPAADVAPSWSPDGQWIAFASQRDGNWDLYIMNRDGSQLRRLTENEATDFAPAWSPRGDLIAFESYRDGNMEIYVVSPDGSKLANLTQDAEADERGPAWSPQGDRILYYSNKDGNWDIFQMKADGSGKQNLTRSEAVEQSPAWQP